MTRLWNDPADFADEMVAGFAAANARRVPAGMVRSVTAVAATLVDTAERN